MLAKMGYKPNMMDPSNVSSEEDCEDEMEDNFNPDPTHKPMAVFPVKPMKMFKMPGQKPPKKLDG